MVALSTREAEYIACAFVYMSSSLADEFVAGSEDQGEQACEVDD